MRRNLPYLGKRSLIAPDSYGSSSWQLADENSVTPSFTASPHCHHQPSAPPLQSFMWSSWNARFFSSPFDYKNNKIEIYNTSIPCCKRKERTGSTKAKHGAGWVTGSVVEKHTRQFRNLYSIPSLVGTQTTLLASHFFFYFGWHAM